MLPLRFADRWRTAGILLLLAVLTAAVLPWFWSDRGQLVSWIAHIDKWAHGITFALLAVWFAGQYRRTAYWRIALGLLAFGVLIEACQRFVRYRTAEWFDVGADAIGIAAGLAIALAGAGGWSLRVEAWLAARAR